jgi:DHA1 family tetracycline resistance protein-like MFS transporter
MSKQYNNQLILIHITVLLTYIGMTLPYSIFPRIFVGEQSHSQMFLYSLLISIYPIGQALGMVVFGNLSDIYGRKKILIFTFAGAILTYIISGIMVSAQYYYSLVFIRFFCGMFEGNFSIAMAVMNDICERIDNKIKWFGRINIALTLGFMLGPFIGSIFSNTDYCKYFNYSTPFYLGAVISAATLVAVKFFFVESLTIRKSGQLELLDPLKIGFGKILNCLQRPQLRNLILVFTFISMAADVLYQFIPVYLVHQWDVQPNVLAWSVFALSAGKIIGNGYLINLIDGLVKNSFITITVALLALTIIASNLLLVTTPAHYIFLLSLLGICLALVITNITTLLSDAADTHAQGLVLSFSQTLRLFTGAILCNIAALSCYISFTAPFFMSIGFSLIALLSLGLFTNKYSLANIKFSVSD